MPEIKFPSEWLKAGVNVEAGDLIKFTDGGVFDEEQEQWVFMVQIFRGGQFTEIKKFGLNKTNFNTIKDIYGGNSDAWIGKSMKVVVIKTQNPQGKLVDSIRLEKPTDAEKAVVESGI